MKNNKNCNSGVTLIELMVSITIFVFIFLSVSQIFIMIAKSQRLVIASQNMQESIGYTFDKMSKEIRMAVKDEAGTCVDVDKIYKLNVAQDDLSFLNYHNQCIRYYLNAGRLMRQQDGSASQFITPSNINISSLRYRLDGAAAGAQQKVLIRFKMEVVTNGGEKKSMIIQTSLSSRFYE